MSFWLFAILLVVICSALSAGKGDSKSVGEEIGLEVRAADVQIAADVDQSGPRSQFQDAFVGALTSNEAVLSNPEVSKVLEQSNRLAGQLSEKDPMCERRWASSCPDGWELLADGACGAPASYRGACRRVESFTSADEKRNFAEKCNAPWPCIDECPNGHDYLMNCPAGWQGRDGGFCSAPAGSETRCGAFYNFAQMDIKTKQEMAKACKFAWPCKTSCAQDFRQQCPEGWNEIPMNPGLCMAPMTYAGSCSFSVNTTAMSSEQKKMFAKKCGAAFPCSATNSAADQGVEGNDMPDGPVLDVAISLRSDPPDAHRLGFMAARFASPSGPILVGL